MANSPESLPLYKREFGQDFELGFDPASLPVVLVDKSYRNDICPCFSFEANGAHYLLWVSFPPELRDYEEAGFSIQPFLGPDATDEEWDAYDPNAATLLDTEEFADVKVFIQARLNGEPLGSAPLTEEEEAYLAQLQTMLMSPPSERIGFYTVGDGALHVYDRSKENLIQERNQDSVDFCRAVDEVGGSLGTVRCKCQIHSVSG